MRCRFCGVRIEPDGGTYPLWVHIADDRGFRWYTCYTHFKQNALPYDSINRNWEAEPDMEYEVVTEVLKKYL